VFAEVIKPYVGIERVIREKQFMERVSYLLRSTPLVGFMQKQGPILTQYFDAISWTAK